MVSFKKLFLAASVAGVSTAEQSICDKYTVALLKNNTAANQYTLLTLLVKTAAIGSFTGNGTKIPSLPGSMVKVPGILSKGMVGNETVELMDYFNGKLASTNVNDKPAAVNWLDASTDKLTTNATYIGEPGSNSERLFSHLFQYFGAALGCSATDYPPYQGDASMQNVHKFMALDYAQVQWFILQVGASAESFGVSSDDIKAVATLLDNTFNYKCLPKSTVIPADGPQLNAICLAETCPLAPNATCSAYPSNDYTAYSQISTASSTVAAATSSAMSMSGTMSASATSSGAASSTTSGTAVNTGAAVANGVSGALAVLAGAAAFIL